MRQRRRTARDRMRCGGKRSCVALLSLRRRRRRRTGRQALAQNRFGDRTWQGLRCLKQSEQRQDDQQKYEIVGGEDARRDDIAALRRLRTGETKAITTRKNTIKNCR